MTGLAAVAVAPELVSCMGQEGKTAKILQMAPLAGKYDVVVAGGGPSRTHRRGDCGQQTGD